MTLFTMYTCPVYERYIHVVWTELEERANAPTKRNSKVYLYSEEVRMKIKGLTSSQQLLTTRYPCFSQIPRRSWIGVVGTYILD